MRGFSWNFVCSGGILTIFCLLEVLASKDAQPLEISNSNLTNVLTENLDGHVQLSTLDLLPTTDSTHHPHQRKVLRYVMKRPIHRNSTSKINRKEHFSVHAATEAPSQVGFEKNSSTDGEVLTDASKAHYAATDGDDKHQVIDEKYKNNDVGGGNTGNPVEKGSEATGSEIGDKEDVQTKKIGRRRKFLENRPHLKHKNHLENFSEATTPISGLSLVLEANSSSANITSEFLHEMNTSTEKTEENQIDLSTQDILFTQTGPENDESLFEFTGSTERDIFDIGNSEQQKTDDPLKKFTVSLPKSFSEKDTDIINEAVNSIHERENVAIAEEVSKLIPNSTTTTASSTISENTTAIEDQSDSTTIEKENITTPESLQSSTRSDVTFSAGLTTEPTVSTTEEMVTVDPAHWYGINVEDGIIQVDPDTEKPENITNGLEDQQRSTEQDTTTSESSVKTTATEEIVTVDPSHWYGIAEDDGTINEVPDTLNNEVTANISENEAESTTEVVPVEQDMWINFVRKENEQPVLKAKGETSNRSDKALPLADTDTKDKHDMLINNRTGVIEASSTTEIFELSAISIISTNSTESGTSENIMKDVGTTHFSDSSNTVHDNITTVSDQSSFEGNKTEEYGSTEDSIDISIKGTQFTASPIDDHTENSTEESITSVLALEENKHPIFMNRTRVSDNDAFENTVTEAIIDSNTKSSYGIEDISTGTEQTTDVIQNVTTISSTVKDMASVVIQNVGNGFKEYTTKVNKKGTVTEAVVDSNTISSHSHSIEDIPTGTEQTTDVPQNEKNIPSTVKDMTSVVIRNEGYDFKEYTTKVNGKETVNETVVDFNRISSHGSEDIPTGTEQTTVVTQNETIIASTVEDMTSVEIQNEGNGFKEYTTEVNAKEIESSEHPIFMNRTCVSNNDAVEDTVTEAVVDFNTMSSHGSEDIPTGTEQTTDVTQNETTITSTVKDMPSVVIQNEGNVFKEYTTEVNEKETENSIDSFKEEWVPSNVKLWINSDEHVLNIVDSDDEETDQGISTSTSGNVNFTYKLTKLQQKSKTLSNKIDEPETSNASNRSQENARSQKEMVLNQNRTVEPMMLEEKTDIVFPTRYFIDEHSVGKESAYIVRNILGNPANVSVHIKIEDEFEYIIPSDVYILEDLENQLLNFTWVSADDNINNSLALALNRTDNVYMISSIYLNILKGGAILYLKSDIKNESQPFNKTKPFNFMIDSNCRNEVTFSNLDFLRIPIDETPNKNIRTGIQQSSEERQHKSAHMEIVIGVIIIVAVLLIIIFLLVEKRRRRTATKTIDNDKTV